VALAIAAPVGLGIFTLAGPLQRGWARKAGTPRTLLASRSAPRATRVPVVSTRQTLRVPFGASLNGTVTQTEQPGGLIVDLEMRLSGGAHGMLRIRLGGTPVGGGGLSMTGSQVDLLARGMPAVLAGGVVSLQGQDLIARVSGGSVRPLDLYVTLNIDGGSGTATGTLRALPTQGGG
jgi:hypothetical protein